jgi:FtsZ-interacting cell division protein ZipA
MESDFNQKVGSKIEEFQEKQKAAQQKLSDLQSKKSRGSELYLSPEQEAEIVQLRKEQVDYSKLIREQEKELRRQKDKLAGKITLLNVVAMPLLVIFLGFILFVQRRRSTRAR